MYVCVCGDTQRAPTVVMEGIWGGRAGGKGGGRGRNKKKKVSLNRVHENAASRGKKGYTHTHQNFAIRFLDFLALCCAA